MASNGFNSSIYVGGTSTAFAGEAFTNTTGDTWQITSTAKRVWDPDTVPDFFDNGTPIDPADIDTIDYLFGKVTFNTSPVGPITADGDYIPLLELETGYQYSVDLSTDVLDVTTFGDTSYSRIPGLKMASGSMDIWDVGSTDLDSGGGTTKLDTLYQNKTVVLFSVTLTAAAKFRCWGYITELDTAAGVADLVGSTVSYVSTTRSDANGQNVNFGIGT